MEFIGFIAALSVMFAVIIRLLTAYFQRVTEQALTNQFRAAEAISEGHIPDQWVTQINRQAKRSRVLGPLGGNKTQIAMALEKVDRLYRYFEKSPFVENEVVREQLLRQLRQTRERWADSTWEKLGAGRDLDTLEKQRSLNLQGGG